MMTLLLVFTSLSMAILDSENVTKRYGRVKTILDEIIFLKNIRIEVMQTLEKNIDTFLDKFLIETNNNVSNF